MSRQDTRRLGKICRIYKNSDDKVIALDEIEIVVCESRIKQDLFHLAVDKINKGRMLLHLGEGDRVVAKIQQLGNYTSIEENSGNYLIPTWVTGPNTNDVTTSIEAHVSVIGDTV